MKKNKRKKKEDRQQQFQVNDELIVVNFRDQLKSQDPTVRDAALQLLRQADAVTVVDNENARAAIVRAEKMAVDDDGTTILVGHVTEVHVVVDDQQSDECADESDQQIEELRKLVEETKGPWLYFGNLQDAEKKPRFMFLCDRKIRIYEKADLHGPILARTRKVAKQYVAWAKEHEGIKLVIADMASITHQSAEALADNGLLAFFDSGNNCCFVVKMVERGNAHVDTVRLEDVIHSVDGWTVPIADAELPKYMVVHDEQRVFYDNGNKRGPILAHTRDVAERYAAEMEKRRGITFSVVEIQTAGEMSVKEALDAVVVVAGANCALVIRSIADDGEATSDFIYPANHPAE